jgi:transketolase
VTAEEHLEHGGLASIVAQVVVRNQPVPMEFVSMKGYAMSGKPEDLLKRYGLTANGIQDAVLKVLRRK